MVYWGVHTIADPPGETIKEQLENWAIPREVFVARMGMTAEQVDQLMEGTIPVTQEIAERLSPIVGMPPHFWTGLEADYRADLITAQAENAAEAAALARVALCDGLAAGIPAIAAG